MERLDKELVNRKLVPSRVKAVQLIEKEFVLVNNNVCTKTSQKIGDNDTITILSNDEFKYVSRGGLKLEKALKVFGVDLKDKVVLDIGSSTGGFTDVALQNDAKRVIAVDVGSDLLHKLLRDNPKILLFENTDIRNLDSKYFKMADIVVTDVSFISLDKIVGKVAKENNNLDIICLIKPQFEVGKEIAKKFKGIIKDIEVHRNLLPKMQKIFNGYGYNILGIDYSPIRGGDGNIEYIAYLSQRNQTRQINFDALIDEAFKI